MLKKLNYMQTSENNTKLPSLRSCLRSWAGTLLSRSPRLLSRPLERRRLGLKRSDRRCGEEVSWEVGGDRERLELGGEEAEPRVVPLRW